MHSSSYWCKTQGSRESPLLPSYPPAILALGATSQSCGRHSLGEQGSSRASRPPPHHLRLARMKGSLLETPGSAGARSRVSVPWKMSLHKLSRLPEVRRRGCQRRCLTPAISASAGVRHPRGCQLLAQPAVAVNTNSFTPFSYGQGISRGFKMCRDMNSRS